ncbi:MAG: choice-of-anchor J domain-containing protein [Candidatus Cloacimonadales bacterium]|jgi:hypothetical protein|nr:choice-of-anchor J domain-containing protein [Candidatus Cloacimonadales bacterium]
MKKKSQLLQILFLVFALTLNFGLWAQTQRVLDDEFMPPTGVVANSTQDQVDLTWNEPGTGIDVWFSHTQANTFDDAIGTGGPIDFEVAQRFSQSQLQAFGVSGATLTKVQFMGHEPSASYTVKIYIGGSNATPGSLALTQAVPNMIEQQWTEVELSQSITIPTEGELWIAIKISTPTGFPACCDAGPAIGNYGNMIFFEDGWYTLDLLADSDANWMIKGMATGANEVNSITFGNDSTQNTDLISMNKRETRILQKASENGVYIAKNNDFTQFSSAKNNRQNTRTLTGYNVWRTPIASMNNENTWTPIATNLTETNYIDESWADVATGEFKYVVKAVYTDGISAPAFSNTIYKNMTCNVTIVLATEDGASPEGAMITLTNQDGNLTHIYSATASSEATDFLDVWHGLYNLKVVKDGYQPIAETDIIINQAEYTHPTIVLPVRYILLSESFDGDFPPEGWEIVDNDADEYNWYRFTNTPYNGAACAGSLSYKNGVGALTPDNWMITPQLSLAAGAASTLTFWVAPQDPSYREEHYGIFVSTTDTELSSFSEVFSETINFTNWEEKTVSLPYAGQDIYIAFRHYDCTDNFAVKIDFVEVDGPNSVEEIVPSARQTSLISNYPNPFNPSTTIKYELANEGNVAIDIYNVKGQKIRSLVNERQSAGLHSINWDGTDDNGKKVSSGIYFFNMKSGKYTSTRKMILMK